MLRKTEVKRRYGWHWMRWLDTIIDAMVSFSKFQETVKDRSTWHTAADGISKSQTQLND